MKTIDTIETLEALYNAPVPASLAKAPTGSRANMPTG
jgi:hypothetical protein